MEETTAAQVSGPGTGLDGELPGVPEHPAHTPELQAIANQVEDCMYDVVDPELGINVVDLGLVYDIWVQNETAATIYMTLTSPACPLTDMLEDQTTTAVLGGSPITELDIKWVWTPPWGPHMITEEGREQLRALGFSV